MTTSTIDMGVLQELLDLCDDGDTSLVTELIEIFLTDGPDRMQTARQGIEQGDLEAVERAAHSLKGSSGNLGANFLMAAAEEMQNASREGDETRVKQLAPEFEASFAAAEDALRNLLAQYS